MASRQHSKFSNKSSRHVSDFLRSFFNPGKPSPSDDRNKVKKDGNGELEKDTTLEEIISKISRAIELRLKDNNLDGLGVSDGFTLDSSNGYKYVVSKNGEEAEHKTIREAAKDAGDGIAIPEGNGTSGAANNAQSEKLTDADVESIGAGIITDYASTVHTGVRKGTIQWLVIHYTAGGSSSSGRAVSNAKMFGYQADPNKPADAQKKERAASADFIVDDTSMVQYNPDPEKYYCWSVGDKGSTVTGGGSLRGICKNSNSISIEVCSTWDKSIGISVNKANDPGFYFTDAVLDNARNLAKMLMSKYSIDIDHVCRHYDVTGKMCPGIQGWNNAQGSFDESKWYAFKNSLR